MALVFASPSEGANAWLFGLSPLRWGLVVILFGLAAVSSILIGLKQRSHRAWGQIERGISRILNRPGIYFPIVIFSILLCVFCFYLAILTFKFTDAFVQVRLQRVLPLIGWGFLFSLQSLIVIPHFNRSIQPDKNWVSGFKHWYPALVALIAMASLSLVVGLTGLGVQPDRTGWDTPGTPVLGTQVFMAWILALLSYSVLQWMRARFGWRLSRLDWLVMLGLWLVAIWMWQSQPLTPTFFSPAPRAPNFEYYPYSDAATLDIAAQNFLVGQGLPDVIEKPLYSLFLAALHLLFGQKYLSVVSAQILVLALFPVALYLIGSKLHNQLSGALLALVIIFRETNAIALSGDILVSHSKLLMTDLPAALGIALFALLVLHWLQSNRANLRWPLWVGGALGMLMLLRSQTVVFLPFILIIAFLWASKNLHLRLGYTGLLLLGFLLATVPWMWRNYQRTGQFGYSQPLQAIYIAKQYSLTPELANPGFPEGTPTSEYVSLGFSNAMKFALTYPGEVARFVSAHFLHNEVSSFLALPMRFDLSDKAVTFYNLLPYWAGQEDRLWNDCCSLTSYVSGTPYWTGWDGALPNDALLPLMVNMVIVAIGIGGAWRKVGRLTLIPIGFHVFYSLSTAIARVSGWRLILPVDWVIILFYCIGLAQMALWVWSYLFGVEADIQAEGQKKKGIFRTAWQQQGLLKAGAIILIAGAFIPVAERLVPAHFSDFDMATAQQTWQSSDFSTQTGKGLSEFLDQPNAKVVWGRAFYPSFYPEGTGEPGGDGSAYTMLPFSRLAFRLVGSVNDQIALPLSQAPEFPNAVDVLVLGCNEENYFRAAAVIFLNQDAPDILAQNLHPFDCASLP